MAYGLVRHHRRRAIKTYFRTSGGTLPGIGGRKAAIHLNIYRTYEKGGPYGAEACMLSRAAWLQMYRTEAGPSRIGYKRKHERCHVGLGGTPTKAVRRAVIGLMKKIQ